jgi:hypothetical protein
MLLNPSYLKDKSVKKVSIATLKRRMHQQKNMASPEKGPNSSISHDKETATVSSKQRINSMKKANMRLGLKQKDH